MRQMQKESKETDEEIIKRKGMMAVDRKKQTMERLRKQLVLRMVQMSRAMKVMILFR